MIAKIFCLQNILSFPLKIKIKTKFIILFYNNNVLVSYRLYLEMTETTEYSKDLLLEGKVVHRGFIPLLYSVLAGSYATPNHAPAAALVNSYGSTGSNSIVPRGSSTVSISGAGFPFVTSTTGCDIRQSGKNIEFMLSISLSGVDPAFTLADELRIQPVKPVITEPPRWGVPLPIPNREYVFDVDMVDGTGGGAVSIPANTIMRARLLVNGIIALFFYDTVLGTETAVTNAWLATIIDVDNVYNLNIFGKYLRASK